MATDVRVVTPITTWGFRDRSEFDALERPGLTISHVEIETGPASIECEYDEALAVPGTIAKIIEAEREGCDAVVIDCMGDPGMFPGRECVSIPVIGPCEAAMHVASMLGHTFSVLTVLKRLRAQFEHMAQVYGVREKLASVRSVSIPVLELEQDLDRTKATLAEEAVRAVRAQFEHMAQVYGVREKLASVRSVSIPVLELEQDLDRTKATLAEEAVRAVEEDGADAIIFGCTGMLGCAEAVRRGLLAKGYDVPVIDPVPWAVKLAASLVDAGLSHSKITYERPPSKPVVGYEIPPLTSLARDAAE